jgi:hypothetical protein
MYTKGFDYYLCTAVFHGTYFGNVAINNCERRWGGVLTPFEKKYYAPTIGKRLRRHSVLSTMSLADELAADLDFSDNELQEDENDQEQATDQDLNGGMDTDDAVIEDEDEQRERIESMQMGNVKSVNQVSKLLNNKVTQEILKVFVAHFAFPQLLDSLTTNVLFSNRVLKNSAK